MAAETTTSPETSPREAQENNAASAPWSAKLAAVALLAMATQIKLPFAGGRLALADLALAVAFAAILWAVWRRGRSLRYPALLGAALAAYGIAALCARAGMSGAVETAQRVEQFFCGFLLFAWLLEERPRWVPRLLLAGLVFNLLTACVQGLTYGFGAVLAPADVLKLKFGFGGAFTGLFRSRTAFGFYLAAVLALSQPSWQAWARDRGLRTLGVLAGTVLVLSFIASGPMLVIACVVLLLTGILQGRRAALVNLAAILLLVLTLPLGGNGIRARTILRTLTPVSEQPGREGVLKTHYLDTIAALRMARKRPMTGVGAGRYQEFVGRCYEELPNPNFNDIETDTQSGLGILWGTVGFAAGSLLLLAFAFGIGRGLRQALRATPAAPMALGGTAALAVFGAGLLFSDPFVNGLAWFLALALAAVYVPEEPASAPTGCRIGWKSILLSGAMYGILTALVLMAPRNRDPLARAGAGPAARPPKIAATTPAPGSAAKTTDTQAAGTAAVDYFHIIDAGDARTVSPPMIKASDSQAANRTILRVPDEAGKPPEGKAPDMKYGGALYSFDLPAKIKVKVWVRVWWEGSCGNTLFVKIDDGAPVTVGNDGTFDAWHWLEAPKVYTLDKGKHNLYILNREDGIRIDQILVTNDMEYYPQGIEEE